MPENKPAGVSSTPDEAVHRIRKLLAQDYKPESFLREMMQNADDAGASRLHLEFLVNGLGNAARNPLLTGPLLVVANDGKLTESDEEALRVSMGGNKADAPEKVGRFGLGLKSIFYWCETFLYCSTDSDADPRVGVVDPYVDESNSDPNCPAWISIAPDDEAAMANCLGSLFGAIPKSKPRFALFIPLRLETHLARGDMSLAGWRWDSKPDDSDRPVFGIELENNEEFPSPAYLSELVLVLAQCNRVQRVSGHWGGGQSFNIERLADPSQSLLGRYRPAEGETDLIEERKDLRATIEVRACNGSPWRVEIHGAEQTGLKASEYHRSEGWPKHQVLKPTPADDDAGTAKKVWEKQPEKALGHAAVTLVAWPEIAALPLRVAARWAAFLPLDTHYNVDDKSNLSKEVALGVRRWDVILHGYFLLRDDRTSIAGVTAPGTDGISAWNRAVRDGLCLPLIPEVIAKSLFHVERRNQDQLTATAQVLEKLGIDKTTLTSAAALVPLIAHGGARYGAVPRPDLVRCRPLNEWNGVSDSKWFVDSCLAFSAKARVLIYGTDSVVEYFLPKGDEGRWTIGEFSAFLEALTMPPHATAREVSAVLEVAFKTFSKASLFKSEGNEAHVALAALQWLQRLQAAGWGPRGSKWNLTEDDKAPLDSKMGQWLTDAGGHHVAVSRGAAKAVTKLAAEQLPIVLLRPVGAEAKTPVDERVREACLAILPEVARRLAADDSTGALSESWRLLARDLVRIVGVGRVWADPRLRDLSLIPARVVGVRGERLVSAADLAAGAEDCLVFQLPPERNEGAGPVRSDVGEYKRASLNSLSNALSLGAMSILLVQLDEAQYLLDTPDNLAKSVLRNVGRLAPDIGQRIPLIKHLCEDHSFGPDRKRAIRLLAHGLAVKEHANDQLLVAPDDTQPGLRLALSAVLRQRHEGWRLIPCQIRDVVMGHDLTTLGIDFGDSRGVLERTLSAAPAAFTAAGMSDEERVAILEAVVGNESLFFELPLHAARDGNGEATFTVLDPKTTFRAGTPIPAEVAVGVTILEMTDSPILGEAYRRLAKFSDAALVGVLLDQSQPHLHAALLIDTLRELASHPGRLSHVLQRDTITALRTVEWLPVKASDVKCVAPAQAVDAQSFAGDIPALLQALVASGVAPRLVLVGRLALAPERIEYVRSLLDFLDEQTTPVRRLERKFLEYPPAANSDWATGPAEWYPRQISGIRPLLTCNALWDGRPAWRLLRELERSSHSALTDEDERALLAIARALRKEFVLDDWIGMLGAVAPPEGANGPKELRDAWFQLAHAMPEDARPLALSRLRVPCANGKWYAAATVAARESEEVPERHRAPKDVRDWLRLGDDDEVVRVPVVALDGSQSVSARELAEYLADWNGEKSLSPLGVAFSLLGSPAMSKVVSGWLGDGQTPEQLRTELGVHSLAFSQLTDDLARFQLSDTAGNVLRVRNLCGGTFDIQLDGLSSRLVEQVIPPSSSPKSIGTVYSTQGTARLVRQFCVVFRHCALAQLDDEKRHAALREAARDFAQIVQGPEFDDARFGLWWARYGESNQAAVEPVRGLLLEELPYKLEELRIAGHAHLKEVNELVAKIRTATMARHDSSGHGGGSVPAGPALERLSKIDTELRGYRRMLEEAVCRDDAARILRELVRAHLDARGYSPASVLLELFQNADDALEQLAVLRGRGKAAELPGEACGVRIDLVDSSDGHPVTLTFSHWGRPVNQHGGERYPEGRKQQWDRDLYYMLRFQVSGKTDSTDGNAARSTGHFGLGFKSVHLVSDHPRVTSGDLAFQIDAALLPTRLPPAEIPEGGHEVHGWMPTRIFLPMLKDVSIDAVFARVTPIAGLLPVMARQIRTVVLPPTLGGTVSVKDAVELVAGWSLGSPEVVLGSMPERYRLLYWRRPGDRGIGTLVLGLQGGCPKALPKDIPSFWVVAPTGVHWNLGYAVNGTFKLDTGRVQIDFKAPKSERLINEQGEAFGAALVSLAEWVLANPARAKASGLAEGSDFLVGLWDVLSRGLGTHAPADRVDVLKQLHAGPRGLGRLASSIRAIRSDMPEGWPQLVGPLTGESSVTVASTAAQDASVQALFSNIPELVGGEIVVSTSIAAVLRNIAGVAPVPLNVVERLDRWTSRKHHQVTPAIAELLSPLVGSQCWDALRREDGADFGAQSGLMAWTAKLRFQTANGSWRAAGELLLPSDAAQHSDWLRPAADTFDDELRRSAFAPGSARLDDSYAENLGCLRVFMRLRPKLDAGAPMLATWARDASTPGARAAAAVYLCDGELDRQMAAEIRAFGGLSWASDRDAWRVLAKELRLDSERATQVEISLFGLEQQALMAFPLAMRGPLDHEEAARRLNELWERWNQPAYRERRLREQRKDLWPDQFGDRVEVGRRLRGDLTNAETRQAWIALFLLAHVQGLGLGGPTGAQHRGFVALLLTRPSKYKPGDTWWDRLFGSDAPDGSWTSFLDEWCRTHVGGAQRYDYWMRILPDMYVATKWWKDYAEVLRRADEFDAEYLLTMATNPDLNGDFDSGDVPAMWGAVKRIPWLLGELRHFEVIKSDAPSKDPRIAFSDSPVLLRVLERLGFFRATTDRHGMNFSNSVYQWLTACIGRDRANFHNLWARPLEIDADLLLNP